LYQSDRIVKTAGKISPVFCFLVFLRLRPAESRAISFPETVLKKAYILFLLLLLMVDAPILAQPYYFRNYQVDNGVSSNTITSILQDKKGFLWFGTRNGLNRFDGNIFRNFKQSLSDPGSLGSNSVISLYEDNQEQLWVGTYKGISLYNPVTEKFALFPHLAHSEIRAIRGDTKNNVWIVADNVLYKYNAQKQALTPYRFNNAETTNLTISPSGTVWIATSTGIIKKYNEAKNAFTDYDLSKQFRNPIYAIQDIYPIDDTTVLVGSMFNALMVNTAEGSVRDIFKESSLKKDIQVHKIVQQSPKAYWFGTETGVYIIDIAANKAIHIQKERENPYSLTDNVIYTLYKDREESIWLGTFFGGINYFSQHNNHFQKYFPHSGRNNLSGNLVHEICSDKKGAIWIGTEDAGLNKLDPKTGIIKHFLPNGEGSISYRNIHGLLADGNELWIGTYEHGLDVMDLRTEKVVRHYSANTGAGSLNSDFIVTLYKTKKNDILVGTWSGLFWYNRQKDTFMPDPYFNMQIQSIHEDGAGTIWVASYGKGIFYKNSQTGEKGNLRYQVNNPNSLPNDYVNSLYEDSEDHLWFCSEGGLTKYNKQQKTFTRFTTKNGLPDNQVFRVIEDNHKTFWASTAKGLVSFDPSFRNSKTYTRANGLISNQFNYNSSYKTADGKLYFGTVNGMISFNPAAFSKQHKVPPVYITGIQVNNKELTVNKSSSALKQSITYTRSISLPHDSASLSFDVAALSYTIPELNSYSYKMEGYDKEWTTIANNRKIYYTKLPPGDYVFRVKGSSSGEVWNGEEVKLRIHISPPFWASIWAYLLYSLIAGGIILTIVRYYHEAQKERNKRKFEAFEREKEREVYNSKIDFFTNVAHEIRTPLTLIKLPFEKLLAKINDPEINETLHTMKKNINRLVDLTNQLLDFRKAEANSLNLNFTKTDVNEAIQEVYNAFKPLAEQKALRYKLELPRISLQAYVDHEVFQKILSNLFSNAIKYANQEITIRLLPFSSEDNFFNLEVRNDGHLIPLELKEKIFEPFYRIKDTQEQQGTGIGLPLSRSLAELHKGFLEFRPSDTNQNVFLLSLPIHQETEINFVKEDEATLTSNEDSETKQEELITEKPFLLLVEDNQEILDFIGKELKARYRILKAHHGQKAIEILQKENVQLIISDIMMPVMNGIDLCKKVKTDLQFSHIPFILLTAKNTLNSRIEGLEVGADAYIEKPFSLEHLQAQVNNLLINRQIIKEYFARSPLTHLKGIACSTADKDFLEELNTIISENITNMDLDVEQLSKLMNMSRPTLYRKIKALSNLSPNELINLSRLKKAAELLSSSKYKINEVSNMVGYTVQGNFSRDFQKQFGMTPSTYLHKLQEEKI
jgi:ligand-binding sensor domain-containing protein/signal transduction histidine kinase/DNA-binding response OmpR family regulator